MKKLLIAMTAAAVGFGAWAEESAEGGSEPTTPQTPTAVTYLNSYVEEFGTSWTLKAPWSYLTKDGETATLEDGELTAGDALSLNTGSKILRGAFAASPVAIPADTGYFFSSKVTFKDPSDTLPELGEQDKFALVVLDNVESVETYSTEADPIDNTTNLWLIAKYGATDKVKRAFKLNIPVTGTKPEQDENGGDVLTNLDKTWLDAPHEIVIKAYSNVMSDSQNARAGFLVMVDGYICKVDYSCEIDNTNVINPSTAVYAGQQYLGFDFTAINDTLRPRYTKNQLLLSMTENNDTLASVDFQGQGVIDNVSLAKTGADFGADATVVTFDGYDADAIASITYGGQTVTGGAYTITGNENVTEDNTVEIVVTLNSGYAIKVGDGAIENTYAFTKTLASAAETISLDVFEIQVRVNGTAYGSFAEALAAADGSAIVLARNVTIAENDTYGLEINSGDVVIDLNGKTIQAGANEEDNTYSSTFTVYDGTLLIKDSSVAKSGKVLISAAAMENDCFAIDATGGRTTIEAGQIGLIGNYSDDTLKLVGGTYTDVGETFTYWLGADEKQYDDSDKTYEATVADGIWTVAEKQIVYYNVTVTASGATVSALNDKYADGSTFTFTVAADDANGYENAVVKVNGNTIQPDNNGQYRVTVNGGDVAIVVEASLKTFVATYSVVDAEGKTVENGATVGGLENSYKWGTTLTFTVESVGDYIVKSVTINGEEANGSYVVSEVKDNVDIVITVEKKAPAGPTVPENQGSVSKPDDKGNVTVSPAPGVTEITISGTVTGTVSIPSSVTKVTGVAFEKLEITYTPSVGGETKVITGAFKADAAGNIVLNEEGSVNGVPVKPAMTEDAPFVVGGDTTDVQVKTIPGLVYKLMRGTDLNSINVERASETGTGAPVTLSDPKEAQRPTKAFYRIKALAR